MTPDPCTPRLLRHRLLSRAGVVAAIALVTVLSACTSTDPADSAIGPSQAAAGSTVGSIPLSPMADPGATPSGLGAAARRTSSGTHQTGADSSVPHPSTERSGHGTSADRSGLSAPAHQAGPGAAATPPFPGDANLTAPVKQVHRERTIGSTVTVATGLSLTDGWYHSTDGWSGEKPPPAAVVSETTTPVRGLQPGMVTAYQIADGGQPTDVWFGAKFFSPIWGSNAWECVVYRGNPRVDGRLDDSTPYTCEWSDYRGENPAPRLTIARGAGTGPVFPGDADVSEREPKKPKSGTVEGGTIMINHGHLGDGWFKPTDRWSDVDAPFPTISPPRGDAFVIKGHRPGMAASYQIYDSSGRATNIWIGAKLYLPASWEFEYRASWECRLYAGNPRVTGRVTVTSPYSCV